MKIDFDRSHGAIAFFVYGIMLLFNVLLFKMIPQIAVIYAIFFTLMLQAINESMQAIDPKVESKYGSWQRFQRNSKRDWKVCLLGLFAGLLLLTPLILNLI